MSKAGPQKQVTVTSVGNLRMEPCEEPDYLYSEMKYIGHGQDDRWQVTRYLLPNDEIVAKYTKVTPRPDGAGSLHLEHWKRQVSEQRSE
jgi:hypothetical protein